MSDDQVFIADMRGISFDGAEYASKRVLCNRCGAYLTCNLAKKVVKCNQFLPILAFRPPLKGIDDRFNTIRMGKAWSKRVVPGSKVALKNTKTDEIFGFAKVEKLSIAEKRPLEQQCAKDNHFFVETKLSPNECAERMEKVLRRAYGNLIYNNNTHETAIYLVREGVGREDSTVQEGSGHRATQAGA